MGDECVDFVSISFEHVYEFRRYVACSVHDDGDEIKVRRFALATHSLLG